MTIASRIADARVAGLAAASMLAAPPAMAQPSAENFFRGQTVRIVVASGPSGGFDTFARLLARHLGRFVPGNPTFVVQNMPGAGGLRAAGYIAKVAPRDGLTIGAVQGGMVKAPLLGLTGADYDSTTLRWIGNLNSEVHVCVAWHTSGITTIKEAMEKELIVGAAAGADSELAPNAFNSLLGTKFKIISGYQDGPRILLAMQRQEVLRPLRLVVVVGGLAASRMGQGQDHQRAGAVADEACGPAEPAAGARTSRRTTTTGRRSISCSATS